MTLPTGGTWNAIASTAAVAAMNNAPTYASVPIYNTHGQLVAAGSAALWSAAGYGNLQAPIDYDQNGNQMPDVGVWSGTQANGNKGLGWGGSSLYMNDEYNLPLGVWGQYIMPGFGSYDGPSYGSTGSVDNPWIQAGMSSSYTPSSVTYSMYALSSPITVVPEPGTLALLGAALPGIGVVYLRKRRGL